MPEENTPSAPDPNNRGEMNAEKGSSSQGDAEGVSNGEEDGEELLNEMEQLPPKVRHQIMELGFFSGPVSNPVIRKVNEKHIDKMLEIAATAEENESNNSKDKRRLAERILYVVVVVLAALLVYFQHVGALNEVIPILQGIFTLAAAVLGGIGIGIKWLGQSAE